MQTSKQLTFFIQESIRLTGNQLNDRHIDMLIARLTKRAQDLKLNTLDEYEQYYKSNIDSEAPFLIGLVTTHHTYFFREISHFDFLVKEGLPEILSRKKKITIWSAASSSGQEVYSLAMLLNFYQRIHKVSFEYEILGTDIDPMSVDFSKNGVYPKKEVDGIPAIYKHDHWISGSGDISQYLKIKSNLANHCSFKKENLLDLKNFQEKDFDIIFCRNVFIYFNQTQINEITKSLKDRLSPSGFLILGLSESMQNHKGSFIYRGPSIYQNPIGTNAPSLISPIKPKEEAKKVLKVVCVDDSPTILTLFKKILIQDKGFELIGTAANGLQAKTVIDQLKPDVVTLDIHMPEMNGVEYLKKHFHPGHPPVVMVSSVSRDDQELAQKALQYGASDYVEKPSLQNMNSSSDEILLKLSTAFRYSKLSHETSFRPNGDDAKELRLPESVAPTIFILFPLSSRKLIQNHIKEIQTWAPRSNFVLIPDQFSIDPTELLKNTSTSLETVSKEQTPNLSENSKIYLLTEENSSKNIRTSLGRTNVVLIYGNPTKLMPLAEKLSSEAKVFQEEQDLKLTPSNTVNLRPHSLPWVKDVGPATSLVYLVKKSLCAS